METPEQRFLRALKVVSAARFFASKRLRRHETWSLWAVTFVSLLILFSSLFDPFGVCIQIDGKSFSFAQVIGSIIITIISIFINGGKFGERAEKMHSCALSLNSLARRAEYAVHLGKDESEIHELMREYDEILAQHENHSDTDFVEAKIRRAADYYGIRFWHRVYSKFRYFLGFTPYILLLFMGVGFIYFVLKPSGLTCI